MTTAEQAERFVLNELNNGNLPNQYIRCQSGECGFDIRNIQGTHYIEVKGTQKNIHEIPFRYLTNKEKEHAEWCVNNEKRYEIFIVTGVGGPDIEISRKVLAIDFLPRLIKETNWRFPIRRNL